MSLFLDNSRYHKTPVCEDSRIKKKPVKALKLRLLPNTKGVVHDVKEQDRLDVMAQRQFDDPTKFWHIADANTELEANTLVEESGRKIIVPES